MIEDVKTPENWLEMLIQLNWNQHNEFFVNGSLAHPGIPLGPYTWRVEIYRDREPAAESFKDYRFDLRPFPMDSNRSLTLALEEQPSASLDSLPLATYFNPLWIKFGGPIHYLKNFPAVVGALKHFADRGYELNEMDIRVLRPRIEEIDGWNPHGSIDLPYAGVIHIGKEKTSFWRHGEDKGADKYWLSPDVMEILKSRYGAVPEH